MGPAAAVASGAPPMPPPLGRLAGGGDCNDDRAMCGGGGRCNGRAHILITLRHGIAAVEGIPSICSRLPRWSGAGRREAGNNALERVSASARGRA